MTQPNAAASFANGLPRHPLYYLILTAVLYMVGGAALFFNLHCTAIAYMDQNVPQILAYTFALVFSSISMAIGLYFGAPKTWGLLFSAFIKTAKNTGASLPPRVGAVLLTGICLSSILFVSFCYYADWMSTWDYLRRFGVSGGYLISACVVLIGGPEFCCWLANGVRQFGKSVEESYWASEAQSAPNRIYLKNLTAHSIKSARQAAAQSANQYQHR